MWWWRWAVWIAPEHGGSASSSTADGGEGSDSCGSVASGSTRLDINPSCTACWPASTGRSSVMGLDAPIRGDITLAGHNGLIGLTLGAFESRRPDDMPAGYTFQAPSRSPSSK